MLIVLRIDTRKPLLRNTVVDSFNATCGGKPRGNSGGEVLFKYLGLKEFWFDLFPCSSLFWLKDLVTVLEEGSPFSSLTTSR